MDRYEVRLTGTGGQGLILAGIILAKAALYEGLNAVQTQSYGPEARGGVSRAEVVISPGEIDYPKVTAPDLLLAMSRQAYEKYRGQVKPDGIIVVDSSCVDGYDGTDPRIRALPVTDIARGEVGREIAANIVALGVIAALSGVISEEAVLRAVLERVPRGTGALNEKALHAGFSAAERLGEGAGVAAPAR